MDELLKALHDVSLVLMPTIGVICLILLALILYRIYVVVKNLPTTVEKVDKIMDTTQKSIDQLEGPLNTMNNVSKTVDVVNDGAVSIASKAVEATIKNADAIVSWVKDSTQNRKSKNEQPENVEKEAEDFGVYE